LDTILFHLEHLLSFHLDEGWYEKIPRIPFMFMCGNIIYSYLFLINVCLLRAKDREEESKESEGSGGKINIFSVEKENKRAKTKMLYHDS
jgi:hypothetical protein